MSSTLTVHVDAVSILTQESFLRHINNVFSVSLASVSTLSTSYMSSSSVRKPPRQISLLRHMAVIKKKVEGDAKEKTSGSRWNCDYHIFTSWDSLAANN